jgi:hypothetical protein
MMERWYTATQPLFFPKLHMMERFARCHDVVVLGEAQWQRHGGHTRCELVGANGPFGLSLRVRGRGQKPLNQLRTVPGWSKDVLRTVVGTYGRAPGWADCGPELVAMLVALDRPEATVADVGEDIIRWLGQTLDLGYRVHRSERLVLHRHPEPCTWMASFAEPLNATDYLQGKDSIRGYFSPGVFAPRQIRLWGQSWNDPQTHTGASVLDSLLRCGRQWTRDLIRANPSSHAARSRVRMEAFE